MPSPVAKGLTDQAPSTITEKFVYLHSDVVQLPRRTRMRKVHTKRTNEQAPGHHIQMDFEFLTPISKRGEKIRRFSYIAIDETAHVRALQFCEQHNQANGQGLTDYIVGKFPFRIKEIRAARNGPQDCHSRPLDFVAASRR